MAAQNEKGKIAVHEALFVEAMQRAALMLNVQKFIPIKKLHFVTFSVAKIYSLAPTLAMGNH